MYACLCTDNKAVKKGIDSRIISYYKHMHDPCTTCDALGYHPASIMPDSATSPSPETSCTHCLYSNESQPQITSIHCHDIAYLHSFITSASSQGRCWHRRREGVVLRRTGWTGCRGCKQSQNDRQSSHPNCDLDCDTLYRGVSRVLQVSYPPWRTCASMHAYVLHLGCVFCVCVCMYCNNSLR